MDEKRKSILKYFTNTFPKWAVILIVIGVIMILAGISKSFGVAVFGLLLAAGGGFGIYNYLQVPTDEQIDQWTREDLLELDQRALKKTGVDKSDLVGETVTMTGPGDFQYVKLGKDGVLRFGRKRAVALNFTQHQLVAYECVVDVTTGNTVNEKTDEYFYKDVVSVSTSTEDGQIGDMKISSGEYFKLTTSGGTSIRVFLSAPEVAAKFHGQMPSNDSERCIQMVRKMLREKKGA